MITETSELSFSSATKSLVIGASATGRFSGNITGSGNIETRTQSRIRIDGTGFERITREPGTHAINMAPGATHYIDSWSTASQPAVIRLHRIDGTVVGSGDCLGCGTCLLGSGLV